MKFPTQLVYEVWMPDALLPDPVCIKNGSFYIKVSRKTVCPSLKINRTVE